MSKIHITPKIEDLIPHKIFKCTELNCVKEFTNYGNLHMHLIRHHKRGELQNTNNEKDAKSAENCIKLYFCPVENCIYHELNTKSQKYFTSLKYIRQHYQKVHAKKSFGCCKCKKMFCTKIQKQSHEINCNGEDEKKFICNECNWHYKSREALLTHAKRKNHKINKNDVVKISIDAKEKIEIPNIKDTKFKSDNCKIITAITSPILIITKPKMKNQSVQTDAITFLEPKTANKKSKGNKRSSQSICKKVETNLKRIKHVQIQTSYKNESTSSTDLATINQPSSFSKMATKCKNEFFNLNFYDTNVNSNIKTPVTEQLNHNPENSNHHLHQHDNNNLNIVVNASDDTVVNNCFEQFVNSNSFCNIETQTEFTDSFLDQMLYSNMHTQTCDEFLSELGLSDIQTQTNWSGITENDYNNHQQHHHHHSKNIDTLTSGPYDELLVSTETQTSFTQCLLECSNNHNNSNNKYNNSNNNGLVNAITQHTQTCDTLLEGLFGGQENDLIASFQSTHTQT